MSPILMATDGSEGAGRALDVAAELAQGLGADLWIINIMSEHGLSELQAMNEFASQEHTSVGELLNFFSERILADAVRRARSLGATVVHARSGQGDVTQAIIEIAQLENAHAIVVGRRGLGRMAGLLLGSVSQKLVTLAPCTVIVVP